jgi:dephospho-CoA kinase
MQVRKKIITLSGMPGAGKGVASEAAKQLGFEVLVLGDVIRQETERRGLEPTPSNMGAVMLQVREMDGAAAVAKRLLPKLEQSNANVIIVEGVRSPHELTAFKSKYEVVSIAIHASPKTRFERLLSRQRSDDPKTLQVFEERDSRELNVGLCQVIALADTLVINEGTIAELQVQMKTILAKLKT